MNHKIEIGARLVTFGAAAWVVGSIAWQAIADGGKLQVPFAAVWLFLGAAIVRLLLWATYKSRRPS